MKNKLKKTLALTSAAALAACQWASTGVFAAGEQANATQFPFTIEGEDMTGATLWTSIYENEAPGYSGEGFVYITGNPVSFKLTVPEDGMYKVNVRGIQILDQGGRLETIAINGVEYSKTVPYCREWTDIDFGVVRLKAGENEISFLNKYGYLAIDTVTVSMAEFPDVTTASGVPCDPKATNEAKALMKYLHSVYGKHILSGQQEIYGNGHEVQTSIRYDAEKDICVDEKGVEYTIDRESSDTDDAGNKFYWHCSGADGKTYTYNTQNRIYVYQNYEQEFDYIYDLTGAYPAVRGFDFMNYNPLYGWDDGTTQRVIEWVNERGGIATACWHINIPTDFDTYTPGEAVDWSKATYKVNHQFKIANAVKEGTKENEYLDLAIEDLAEQFIILQDNNVPILFRPFHEAEGNPSTTSDPIDGSGAWFWWSQDGAEDYKELWKYLYTQLTEKYDLHNIIWEQNLYAWSDASAEWYSGDDYVDIVGWDKYDTQYNRHDGLTSGPNEDCNSNVYWSLYDYVKGNKMAAIMENSTIPSLGNMTVEQTAWLYFCTWYDNGQENFMSGDDYNNPDTVKELYQSDFCINLDDLPEDLYVYSGQSDIMYGDTNEDGEVNLADAVLIMQNIANPSKYKISEQGKLNGDVDENGDGITSNDAFKIQQFVLGIITSLEPTAATD
ncbi:MAG TPA: glycosyl hydrolase [Ruminococcus sp.]